VCDVFHFSFWFLGSVGTKDWIFLYSSVLFNSGWVFYFLCKTKTIDHSMLDRLQVRFSSPSSSVFSFYLLLHLYAFFSGYENSDKFTSKDELRSCIFVAWICHYDFLFLGFVFFLFVCSRSTKDEIFCCSFYLVRFEFFA